MYKCILIDKYFTHLCKILADELVHSKDYEGHKGGLAIVLVAYGDFIFHVPHVLGLYGTKTMFLTALFLC